MFICYNFFMDNKAYLDSIAVKGKKETSPLAIFTPTVIKIIAVSVVMIIAMFIVGGILNSGNSALKTDYEKLYYTFSVLADDDAPFEEYIENVNSSEVRAAYNILQSSLVETYTHLQSEASQLKINTDSLSSKATEAIDSEIAEMSASFDDGLYAGTLDINFANATYLEISRIIALESSIRSRTNNDALATTIDDSLSDLQIAQNELKKFINKQ